MDEVVHNILDLAKQNLVKDGKLLPVAFLFKGDEMLKIFPMTMSAGKGGDHTGMNTAAAGTMAAINGADRVILLWEAAMKKYTKNTKPEDVDETELPLTYPKSMRTECIILLDVQLVGEKSHIEVVPFKGGEGEPVEFIENELSDMGGFESRFIGILRDWYGRMLEKMKEV